jgi:hypothetical protein
MEDREGARGGNAAFVVEEWVAQIEGTHRLIAISMAG